MQSEDEVTPAEAAAREPSPMYWTAMAVSRPVMRLGAVAGRGPGGAPESGPVLVVGNHDSHWDPIAVGVAAIRVAARSKPWPSPTSGRCAAWAPCSTGWARSRSMRGSGDAEALAKAIEALRQGACIGVFPEGTRSRGKVLRARSGVGRLALEVPETKLVCVAVEGTSDLHGLPAAPPAARPLLRAGGRPGPARRAAGRARGPAAGRDPRARAALDLLPQALLDSWH